MSIPELPGDPSSWPKDPYRLLGVRAGAPPGELKRAYHQLIRRYKPEHAPREFQLIRDAYEAIRRQAGAFNDLWSGLARTSAEDGGSKQEQRVGSGHPGPASSRAEDPWSLACRGDLESAYGALLEWAERSPGDESAYLRLHWLLVVEPGLDPARSSSDWLFAGLRSAGTKPGLRELLRRAVATDPGLAIGPNYARLMQPGLDLALLPDVAAWRWKAARGLRRWDVILDDVKALRGWVLEDDEGAWPGLLVAAASQLIWAEGTERDAVGSFCREIERRTHRSLDLSDELLELDFALEVTAGWLALGRESGPLASLARLLPLTWDESPAEVLPLLRAYLSRVARTPREALTLFDRLGSKSPAVLHHLTSLLDRLCQEQSPFRGAPVPSDLVPVLVRFIAENAWWDYRALRPRLLEFCVREAIPPDLLARTLGDRPEFAMTADRDLAQSIGTDWPILSSYRAWELSSV